MFNGLGAMSQTDGQILPPYYAYFFICQERLTCNLSGSKRSDERQAKGYKDPIHSNEIISRLEF
jgi:hypothetical protein